MNEPINLDDWIEVTDDNGKPADLTGFEEVKDDSPSFLKGMVDETAKKLPLIGGMAGGMMGGVSGGPAGAIGGAAAGGFAGKAAENLYNTYENPKDAPESASEYLTGPLQEAGVQGALGAGGEVLGAGLSAAAKTPMGQAVGSGLSKVGQFIAEKGKGALGAIGRLATGVDKDAMVRQLERPVETAAMEQPTAVYELGQKGIGEMDAKQMALGKDVNIAKNSLVKTQGADAVDERVKESILKQGGRFLSENRESPSGYSGITRNQAHEILGYMQDISDGTVEDLVKMRDSLDWVENLAEKWGAQSLSPYERYLMSLRGQINGGLRQINPEFKAANEAYSNFKNQSEILGKPTERRAESVFNNLYGGANKTAQQNAASQVLPTDTLESAKDIAANKAFGKIGPAGSEQGIRNMAKAAIAGASIAKESPEGLAVAALMFPDTWKYGLRGLGRLGDKLGQFGPVLEQAAKQGPRALSVTFGVLQKNPKFQQVVSDPETQKLLQEQNQ